MSHLCCRYSRWPVEGSKVNEKKYSKRHQAGRERGCVSYKGDLVMGLVEFIDSAVARALYYVWLGIQQSRLWKNMYSSIPWIYGIPKCSIGSSKSNHFCWQISWGGMARLKWAAQVREAETEKKKGNYWAADILQQNTLSLDADRQKKINECGYIHKPGVQVIQ